MRVGVSLLNFRLGCMGGIETYFRMLIKYLSRCAEKRGDEIIFFVNQETYPLLNKNDKFVLFDLSRSKMMRIRFLEIFPFYFSKKITQQVNDAKLDCFFVPHQAVFPKRVSVPVVLTAHDVQHLFYPKYFSWIDRVFRRIVWARSLRDACGIIAISIFTKKSLVDRCDVSEKKIWVVYHGFDPIIQEPSSPPPVENFLFYPAATYPHKGHLQLLETYAELRKKEQINQKLVFTGMKTKYWKKIKNKIKALGIEDEVIHLGFVSRKDVLALYKACHSVLFPTQFEGFGLPVLEALVAKKRIVCSSLSVFDELGVPKKWQVDFSSPVALKKALDTSVEKEIDWISWDESVCQTLEAIERFLCFEKKGKRSAE